MFTSALTSNAPLHLDNPGLKGEHCDPFSVRDTDIDLRVSVDPTPHLVLDERPSSSKSLELIAWRESFVAAFSHAASPLLERPPYAAHYPSADVMMSAWSSATTGKPQLSYAERLRRAKEGPRPEAAKDDNGNGGTEYAVDTEDHGAGHSSGLRSLKPSVQTAGAPQSVSEGSSQVLTSASMSPIYSSRGTARSSSPSISSIEPTTSAPVIDATPLQTSVSTRVNVWEARRRQLEEKAKDDVHRSNLNGIACTVGDGGQQMGDHVYYRKFAPSSAAAETRSLSVEPSVVSNEQEGDLSTQSVVSKLNKSTVEGVKPKVGRGQRKKQQQRDTTHSLTDFTNWPSPNIAAIEQTTRSFTTTTSSDTEKLQPHDEKGNVTAASPVDGTSSRSRTAILDGLDVELLRQPKTDKARKGKQWIPIVPTISHATATMTSRHPKRAKPVNGAAALKWPTNVKDHTARRPSFTPESYEPRSRLNRDRNAAPAHAAQTATPRREGQSSTIAAEASNSYERKLSLDDGEAIKVTGERSRLQESRLGHRSASGGHTSGSATGSRPSNATRATAGQGGRPDTARGVRGRGGQKRAVEAIRGRDTLAFGTDAVANSDVEGGGEPATVTSTAKLKGTSPINAPAGPRYGARRSSSATTQSAPYGYYTSGAYAYGGIPYVAPHISPALSPDGALLPYPTHAPPHLSTMPEQTPAEFAPKGTATATEPTQQLLQQIEFYFSHQNLQGDFFLRKSMDVNGFVPLKVVASFNRVKHLTEGDKTDLLGKTLLFSKVLQLSDDKTKIRKAFEWEPYVLLGGERAQQFPAPAPRGVSSSMLTYQQAVPPPSFFQSVHSVPAAHSPSASYRSMRSSAPRHSIRLGLDKQGMEASGAPDAESGNPTRDLTGRQAGGQSSTVPALDEVEEEDDDEPSLGLVAATGLAGTLSANAFPL